MSPSGVKKQSPKMSSRLRVAGVPLVETACWVCEESGATENVGAWMLVLFVGLLGFGLDMLLSRMVGELVDWFTVELVNCELAAG